VSSAIGAVNGTGLTGGVSGATWIARVRARGTGLPIWIGLPGSIDQPRLLRISVKIGLGASARFLRTHRGCWQGF
jgi:hypothetical protein